MLDTTPRDLRPRSHASCEVVATSWRPFTRLAFAAYRFARTRGQWAVLAGALGSAAAAFLVGIAYAVHPNVPVAGPASAAAPFGWWLTTLALVGATALAAGGAWQLRTSGWVRVAVLAA